MKDCIISLKIIAYPIFRLVEASTLNKQIEAATQDIDVISKRIRAAEEMLSKEKGGKNPLGRLPGGLGGGARSVTYHDTDRVGSFESSILSENTVRVRGHYQSSSINPSQKRRTRAMDEGSMSGQCSKCNLF